MGNLRFRLPVLPETWQGVYNAVNRPKACPLSLDLIFGTFKGTDMWNDYDMSEDCLYLNVFVPKKISSDENRHFLNKKLSVMVWIYGGGFYSGSSTLEMYEGKYLAAHSNTIVVSMNYRLGAFGFFSMDSAYTPANVGMYDQLMALDWVQNNIAEFGGDPESVTLFGESAGSVSVSLHLLSPLSQNKFQRAILQSGTAIMPWAIITPEKARRRSHEVASIVGCERNSTEEIVECMLRVDMQTLLEKQWQTRGILQFPFVPTIDGVFLTDHPDKLMAKGQFKKCPILAGSNKNEASFFLLYDLYTHVNLTHASMDREAFESSLNKVFYFYPQYPQMLPKNAHQAILYRYSPPWTHHNDTFLNLKALDMAVSDAQFLCPMNSFMTAYAREGEAVYSYYFTHRFERHLYPEWMGVLHADEIFLTFSHAMQWGTNNYSASEVLFSKRLIQFWSNFAKTGFVLSCFIFLNSNLLILFQFNLTISFH